MHEISSAQQSPGRRYSAAEQNQEHQQVYLKNLLMTFRYFFTVQLFFQMRKLLEPTEPASSNKLSSLSLLK